VYNRAAPPDGPRSLRSHREALPHSGASTGEPAQVFSSRGLDVARFPHPRRKAAAARPR